MNSSILKEVKIKGKTLMSGKECEVTLKQSNEKGIRFFLEGKNIPIEASVENVISTDNCTVIGNAVVKIALVEHFMAACAFTGIDSLDVYINYHELPILDGSASEWINLFKEAGIEEYDFSPVIEIPESISLNTGKSLISIMPDEELKVTYCVDFKHTELKNRWYTFEFSKDINEIIKARTFGYLQDLETFQNMGMALGVTIDNTVGLTEDGYTTKLRSEFEPIKHKILDLIGDLYLTGINPIKLKAHIIAKEAGHKTHVEFARMMKSSMEKELCQKQ